MRKRNGRTAPLAAMALLLVLAVAQVPSSLASPGEEFTVRESGIALRAQPSKTAESLLTLTPADRLVEFERRGGWVRVGVFRQVGGFGWVQADDLVPLPRPAPPPQPTPQPTPRAAAPPFLLKIDGTPAILYRGSCTLLGADGVTRSFPLSGPIPKDYSFDTAAVSCLVRKWDARGRMWLRLYRGRALLAELQTSGPFNQVWVHSDGPWGPADARLTGGLSITPGVKR